MKKIILSILCITALSACGASEEDQKTDNNWNEGNWNEINWK